MLKRISLILRAAQRARAAGNSTSLDLGNAGDSPEMDAQRRAIAAAHARNSVEIDRCRRLGHRIADLEDEFDRALDNGDAEAARRSATELAQLEKQRAACHAAQKTTHDEIDRLKSELAAMAASQNARMEAAV